MGLADRAIRILVAVAVIAFYFGNLISGTTAIILLALAGILILTSFIGVCPVYSLLGISTQKNLHKI